MAAKKLPRLAFLLPALCLILSLPGCSKQSVGAREVASEPAEPDVLLLVFHDPKCEACKKDEPIVDSMRGKVDMVFFGWGDRELVKHFNVRRVPTYILITDGETGETWRTYSAANARDRLGLTE